MVIISTCKQRFEVLPNVAIRCVCESPLVFRRHIKERRGEVLAFTAMCENGSCEYSRAGFIGKDLSSLILTIEGVRNTI